MNDYLTVKEASDWASEYLNKNVTASNISYLIQYGRVKQYKNNGNNLVSKEELIRYYKSINGRRENDWKERLGDDLNWALSFDWLKETDTTKHVHRLHPYKGKFIPQLVEYFLDSHVDDFKKEIYFNAGDIVLDPFSGSGTTMVQAGELGLHAVGVDISAFNALISNVKVKDVDFEDLQAELRKITQSLRKFISESNHLQFENELLTELNIFNKKFFPSPEFKIKVRQKEINEREYVKEKEDIFLPKFNHLLKRYNIQIKQSRPENFIDKWYLQPVKDEIYFVFEQLKKVKNPAVKKVITVILSRTIRSCRATTHADLATLREPVTQTYYCKKHGKICKPLFSIISWWERYSKDTVARLKEYSALKTGTYQICLQGDARTIDIFAKLKEKNKGFGDFTAQQKIKGIFSSPPYVGLIDYHEQHAYAYDLFGFERNDELEIGPLFKGQGGEARNSYIEGISQVLNNAKRFFQNNYDVFLVANDKYNIYPKIAKNAGMQIVNKYKRPVLNRTEKDKGAYAEIIFHLKEK
ncbi:DNA methylase N-4/N-6 domain protein [Chloroherpeton thalassium ATCC 35110]|uniref:DNA methylase N-4/N-6 domain protein n=1 Tax=Chloroherpeton thalassium (strain ATCC 35110 / GB-78) TaxID=517418 RepID=B3QYI9_CHLT3|nr:DNA methyltransferase [Chloroherpeton thalassium]ACF13617.1 DNA methylase N-4/N-6 domain protein [Chloroherpeton thalassium ATCC 35110]